MSFFEISGAFKYGGLLAPIGFVNWESETRHPYDLQWATDATSVIYENYVATLGFTMVIGRVRLKKNQGGARP